MRVLVCAYACAPPGSEGFSGGEELLGWKLVQHLSRHHDVDVLVSGRYESSIRGASLPDETDFIFLGLPSFLSFLLRYQGGIQLYAYLWQCRAALQARRLDRERQYDVFHHVTYANDWMASHAGAVLGIPYVRGPGGGAHRVPKEILSDYDLEFRAAQRLRSIGQWLMRLDPFYVLSQARASHLFVCTKESRAILPESWREKCSLLPVVGLDPEDFPESPPATRTSEEEFLVVTAGKLLRHKGFDLAIEAFANLDELVEVDAELKVVGEGPERARLRALTGSLSIAGSVEFAGWVDREKLLGLLAEASVLLFPSLRDGGGAVVVEAMASGTPVVCLEVGGPGLHVTEGSGVKVPPADRKTVVADLSRALARLANSEELRRRLSTGARRRAQDFLWSAHVEKILGRYRDALRTGSRGDGE